MSIVPNLAPSRDVRNILLDLAAVLYGRPPSPRQPTDLGELAMRLTAHACGSGVRALLGNDALLAVKPRPGGTAGIWIERVGQPSILDE